MLPCRKRLNTEDMTMRSLFGETTYLNMEKLVGKEKLEQFASYLNPVLKNRRAITAASAVLDVALILAGIKIFQVCGGGLEFVGVEGKGN
jgi:hypothetical protein